MQSDCPSISILMANRAAAVKYREQKSSHVLHSGLGSRPTKCYFLCSQIHFCKDCSETFRISLYQLLECQSTMPLSLFRFFFSSFWSLPVLFRSLWTYMFQAFFVSALFRSVFQYFCLLVAPQWPSVLMFHFQVQLNVPFPQRLRNRYL